MPTKNVSKARLQARLRVRKYRQKQSTNPNRREPIQVNLPLPRARLLKTCALLHSTKTVQGLLETLIEEHLKQFGQLERFCEIVVRDFHRFLEFDLVKEYIRPGPPCVIKGRTYPYEEWQKVYDSYGKMRQYLAARGVSKPDPVLHAIYDSFAPRTHSARQKS